MSMSLVGVATIIVPRGPAAILCSRLSGIPSTTYWVGVAEYLERCYVTTCAYRRHAARSDELSQSESGDAETKKREGGGLRRSR